MMYHRSPPNEGEMMSDDKYVTFKRAELTEALKGQPISVTDLEVKDAVVIRRQDKFAQPCLSTYADCIAIVISETDSEDKKRQLSRVADYFHDQAKLAAEEGWKLPDV
jgi:hypothetical protein